MFSLIKLVFWPISFAMMLVRLPMTIIGCVTKLGCMLVVGGIIAAIVAGFIYLN